MAVPFYLPEGGHDDTASSSSGGASSDGTSTASSQSPNTTSSATQTPMQSPLVPGEQLVMAICEALHRYSNAAPVFQYPAPPSPSCSVHSPAYINNGGEMFFPRGRSTPRTPRTSVSFAAGEEVNFFRSSAPPATPSQPIAPQSAPPMPNYHQQPNYYHGGSGGIGYGLAMGSSASNSANSASSSSYTHYTQYTPPPTPTTAATSSSAGAMLFNMQPAASGSSTAASTSASANGQTSGSTQTTNRLQRSLSDAARRSRLTSTGEDEREYHSEHETSWDEFDERFDNFTAGRERLQEFNGRIPPRKKKKDVPKTKEKKEQSFTWPAVVTVFVFAMGCGFLVAR